MEIPADAPRGEQLQPREYQLEMLRCSLAANIIVAMDTGSGKTLVAILRIREELERTESAKIIWFLCPTVTLCEQQLVAIQRHLPSAPSRLLCGRNGVDTWSSREVWEEALHEIKIVVCTHQVLLDALTHGFVRMPEISLLIFDEAHHCTKKHPASRIMANFYHETRTSSSEQLPKILGLTASPITRNRKESLKDIEQNLNAISKTPKLHRTELMNHVNRPLTSALFFKDEEILPSAFLKGLEQLYLQMNIHEDPCVKSLKDHDQMKYEEILLSRKTYSQINVKRLLNVAKNIHVEFGASLTENYITSVVSSMRLGAQGTDGTGCRNINLPEDERLYLYRTLQPLDVSISPLAQARYSSKLTSLLRFLETEMDSSSTAIVFVETRAATKLLADLLSSHPMTKHKIRPGCFVGQSQFHNRSFRISEVADGGAQEEALNDLHTGKLNLLVSTTVCEEGIDVSACNLVVCFDPPKNIKSFIQRRGRARNARSKLVLMCCEGSKSSLGNWIELEKEMVALYMDDTRQLQDYEDDLNLDSQAREFSVSTTGAKITSNDAVQHLYHFCNKLPAVQHTRLVPIFTYKGPKDDVTCQVKLPVTVHPSIQTFESKQTGSTWKLARRDAAFEAYVGLYNFGLINEHLLPSHSPEAEAINEYHIVARRERRLLVKGEADPWVFIASLWQTTRTLFQSRLDMGSVHGSNKISVLILSPHRIPLLSQNSALPKLQQLSEISVTISEPTEISFTETFLEEARQITWTILASAHREKLDPNKTRFPLLFVPVGIHRNEYKSWLQTMKSSYPAVKLKDGNSGSHGLIRSNSHPFHRFRLVGTALDSSVESTSGFLLQCVPFKNKMNSIHSSFSTNLISETDYVLLDPTQCEIDRLPIFYAMFAALAPFIIYQCTASLIAEEVDRGILAPVAFSNSKVLIPALTTPYSGRSENYQRLEFLGDCILKTLTSVHLMSKHPAWHEGLLSNRKDNIVSNARLSKAAEDGGLTPYIMTAAFVRKKWRPVYIDDLLSQPVPPDRTMSMKVMADVAEAILGAAYVDGHFPRALALLSLLLPEIIWEPLPTLAAVIQETATSQASKVPTTTQISEVEAILGHTFKHKSLLNEAITHPSYMSACSPASSYQRLEFLGDALLDYIVTTTIYKFSDDTEVHRMHLLRTAAVNASFLAFHALSTTTSRSVADIRFPASSSRTGSGADGGSNFFATQYKHLSLPLYLRFSPNAVLSAALAATRKRFEYLKPMISASLDSSKQYPWRLLAALKPEKVFSDLVESSLAAVWIDSGGDFGRCEALLRRFGILGWLESALEGSVKVWHPKEELGQCAGNRKVKYQIWKDGIEQGPSQQNNGEAGSRDVRQTSETLETVEDIPDIADGEEPRSLELGRGAWSCRVFVGEVAIATAHGWNRLEVETAAAEEAIVVLKSGPLEASADTTEPFQVPERVYQKLGETDASTSEEDTNETRESLSVSRGQRSFGESFGEFFGESE